MFTVLITVLFSFHLFSRGWHDPFPPNICLSEASILYFSLGKSCKLIASALMFCFRFAGNQRAITCRAMPPKPVISKQLARHGHRKSCAALKFYFACAAENRKKTNHACHIYIVDFWIVLGIILCALVCMCSWRSTSWTKVKTKLVFLLEWGVGAVYLGHCFSHGTVGSSFLSTVLLFCFSDYFSFLCFLASLLYFLLLFSFFMLCCFLLLCFFAFLLLFFFFSAFWFSLLPGVLVFF